MFIPLKKAEAALKSLSLFGKIATLKGTDYFIAEGKGKSYYFDNKLVSETKFFYTQDCVKWLDLNPVDEETAKRCLTITTTMSGDPSQVYTVSEPAPKEEGAEEAPAEEEEPAEVVHRAKSKTAKAEVPKYLYGYTFPFPTFVSATVTFPPTLGASIPPAAGP